MLDFCPSEIGAKGKGRAVQCRASGLSYEMAAKFFIEATPKNFQSHYNKFIQEHPAEAKIISNLRSNGVGPGEMVAWFLFDNITVGGANATCDLAIDNQDFAEFKGGKYSKPKHRLYDFKLSRDHNPSVKFLLSGLESLNSTGDLARIDKDGNVFCGSNLICSYKDEDFRQKISEIIEQKQQTGATTEFRDKIVTEWKDMIFSEYLDGKTMAMIQANNLYMWHFGQLTKEMVGLYRLHRNQPWAFVDLPR